MDTLVSIPSLVHYHWTRKNFNWPMMVYISLVHVLAVMSLPYLFSSNWKTLLFAFALWPVTVSDRRSCSIV